MFTRLFQDRDGQFGIIQAGIWLKKYNNMEKPEEEKFPKRALTDAERASKYRQKQKQIKQGLFQQSKLEAGKEKLKLMNEVEQKSFFQTESFKMEFDQEEQRTLMIFAKNRKHKLKQESLGPMALKPQEVPIQEKIQKLSNYEFAELQKTLTIPHTQKEREELILEKLDQNLFLFMDYMTTHEPPYSDFLKDVVETHGKMADNIFIKLFVIVCTRYEGQDIEISASMAQQAMSNLTGGLPNIQASFGLLRLMYQNEIALTEFPIELLLQFQIRYDQTISSFIKGITRVKRSVLELLPPTVFLFTSPMLRCLKNGADVLHRQIPLDYLPLIIEIVSYSFADDPTQFEQFLQIFKDGCLNYFEFLRETDFTNILHEITASTIQREPGFFGSLNSATTAIQKSFELVREFKVEKFDSLIADKIVNGGQEQFQLMKAQPKQLASKPDQNLEKLARFIIKNNSKFDFSLCNLMRELTDEELQPFKLMKIGRLLEIQEIALKISLSRTLDTMLFISYKTGQGKTALCIGYAALLAKSERQVLIVNHSVDLTFRDFKRANQIFSGQGIDIHYLSAWAPSCKLNTGVTFITGEALFSLLDSDQNNTLKNCHIIIDEFDSLLLKPQQESIQRASKLNTFTSVVGFTGSELQQYHQKFLVEITGGSFIDLNLKSLDVTPAVLEVCEVFSLVRPFRQRIIDLVKIKIQSVPIIIILDDGNDQLQSGLSKAMISVFNLTKMDSSSVESSIQVFNQQNQGAYSVFIISDEQGCGLDFQSSSLIEKNGGVYLIIAQLPKYFLQFRQQQGRTGRIGNKGCYSIIVFDNTQKYLEGSIYLQQKLEKLKNDELQFYQKIQPSNEPHEVLAGEQDKQVQASHEGTLTEHSQSSHLQFEESKLPDLAQQFQESSLLVCEEVLISGIVSQQVESNFKDAQEEPIKASLKTKRQEKINSKQDLRFSKRLSSAARQIEKTDDEYFASYSNPEIHQEMLADSVRNHAYEQAIQLRCKGKVVVDVGTGSGILSIIAAQNGAQAVFGIEYSDIIQIAKENIKKNSLEGKIILYKEKAEEAILPVEKVDIIVSEWMGYFLLCENMLGSALDIKERYLSPEGEMIPNSGSIFISAIRKPQQLEGIDLSSVDHAFSSKAMVTQCPPEWIVSSAAEVYNCDFNLATVNSNSFESDFQLLISCEGQITGLVGWFDMIMTEGVTLSTSPSKIQTHWQQTIFTFPHSMTSKQGELLHGKIRVSPRPENHRALLIRIAIKALQGCKGFSQDYLLN